MSKIRKSNSVVIINTSVLLPPCVSIPEFKIFGPGRINTTTESGKNKDEFLKHIENIFKILRRTLHGYLLSDYGHANALHLEVVRTEIESSLNLKTLNPLKKDYFLAPVTNKEKNDNSSSFSTISTDSLEKPTVVKQKMRLYKIANIICFLFKKIGININNLPDFLIVPDLPSNSIFDLTKDDFPTIGKLNENFELANKVLMLSKEKSYVGRYNEKLLSSNSQKLLPMYYFRLIVLRSCILLSTLLAALSFHVTSESICNERQTEITRIESSQNLSDSSIKSEDSGLSDTNNLSNKNITKKCFEVAKNSQILDIQQYVTLIDIFEQNKKILDLKNKSILTFALETIQYIFYPIDSCDECKGSYWRTLSSGNFLDQFENTYQFIYDSPLQYFILSADGSEKYLEFLNFLDLTKNSGTTIYMAESDLWNKNDGLDKLRARINSLSDLFTNNKENFSLTDSITKMLLSQTDNITSSISEKTTFLSSVVSSLTEKTPPIIQINESVKKPIEEKPTNNFNSVFTTYIQPINNKSTNEILNINQPRQTSKSPLSPQYIKEIVGEVNKINGPKTLATGEHKKIYSEISTDIDSSSMTDSLIFMPRNKRIIRNIAKDASNETIDTCGFNIKPLLAKTNNDIINRLSIHNPNNFGNDYSSLIYKSSKDYKNNSRSDTKSPFEKITIQKLNSFHSLSINEIEKVNNSQIRENNVEELTKSMLEAPEPLTPTPANGDYITYNKDTKYKSIEINLRTPSSTSTPKSDYSLTIDSETQNTIFKKNNVIKTPMKSSEETESANRFTPICASNISFDDQKKKLNYSTPAIDKSISDSITNCIFNIKCANSEENISNSQRSKILKIDNNSSKLVISSKEISPIDAENKTAIPYLSSLCIVNAYKSQHILDQSDINPLKVHTPYNQSCLGSSNPLSKNLQYTKKSLEKALYIRTVILGKKMLIDIPPTPSREYKENITQKIKMNQENYEELGLNSLAIANNAKLEINSITEKNREISTINTLSINNASALSGFLDNNF